MTPRRVSQRAQTGPPARSTDNVATHNAVAFLDGGGEMGARMRAYDWTTTPLGPPHTWTQSLRTVVRIMLDSRYAMWMLWGPDLTFFCNDAYLPTVGIKRDWVLGARSDKVWAEIWPDIGPRIEHVRNTGEATWDEGLLLFLERSGYPEETYHTFSYSPVYDDDATVAGMLCVVTEDTERQLSERRIALLGAVGTDMASIKSEAEVFAVLDRHIGLGVADLPCTLTYVQGERESLARRVAHTGFGVSAIAAMPVDSELRWPIARVLETATEFVVDDVEAQTPPLPAGPWREPPRAALLLPIQQQGQARPAGVFVAFLNRYRPLDDAYRRFLDLLVAQIASGLANARSYAEERRRTEALAELDRAKTAFFSNVSHEFRTPLTLMMGPLEELLRDGGEHLADDLRASLTVVHRNCLRLLKLVNSLLDFSRLEAGRLQARYEKVDIGAMTAELAGVFRPAVERAGLTLRVECETVRGDVYVDASMWEKIVFNLLSNAFKHTLAGEIRVRVAAGREHAVLTVADTGVGIRPKRSARCSIGSTACRTHVREPTKAPASALHSCRSSSSCTAERSTSPASSTRARRSPCRCRTGTPTCPRTISSETATRNRWVRSPRRDTSTKRSAGCHRRRRAKFPDRTMPADAPLSDTVLSSTTTPTCANTCESCCPRGSTSSQPSMVPKRSRRSMPGCRTSC